ncbi:hypothetical protein ACU5AY_01880 [Rhizobium sp. PAMB 3174]
MAGFKARLLKPIAAAAILVTASNAYAASPSEDDFLSCLSLVAKAQSIMSEVEEYSTYAARLWGYPSSTFFHRTGRNTGRYRMVAS